MSSFPLLARTGFSSLAQPKAIPPPPSLDSLTNSKIIKLSNLSFPSSLYLVSSITNNEGFNSLITFLRVGSFCFKPAALTPRNLSDLEKGFALFLSPLLCFLGAKAPLGIASVSK